MSNMVQKAPRTDIVQVAFNGDTISYNARVWIDIEYDDEGGDQGYTLMIDGAVQGHYSVLAQVHQVALDEMKALEQFERSEKAYISDYAGGIPVLIK